MPELIALFTDFGAGSPYLGQMRAVLVTRAPGYPVVELADDAPAGRPRLGAYLLAALVSDMPEATHFLCVVDPGVGSGRGALALRADERWFVGPDNGLMALAARHASKADWYRIDWRPAHLSDSFHGRDLFAPALAELVRGRTLDMQPVAVDRVVGHDWPDELPQVIYLDHYGNAMTGLRAADADPSARLQLGHDRLCYARTFSEVSPGAAFWYRNSCGLVEISVNCGRADQTLGLIPGDPVGWA